MQGSAPSETLCIIIEPNMHYILWYADPLLGGDHEIGECTVATAKQQPTNNTEMVFSARSPKQQLNSNKGSVLPMQSVPRCYKWDKLGAEVSSESTVGVMSSLKDSRQHGSRGHCWNLSPGNDW
jgi:hypothetical protein